MSIANAKRLSDCAAAQQDAEDLAAARRAMRETGEIPWDRARPLSERQVGPAPLDDDRHLRRLLQEILLEIRATRQYVNWLHDMIADHDFGKEAQMPTSGAIQTAAKLTRRKEKAAVREFLSRRAASGIGSGGAELTDDERQRIASGEDIESVLSGI